MLTIWKYPLAESELPPAPSQVVYIRPGPGPLSVGLDASGRVCMWSAGDDSQPPVARTIRAVLTGVDAAHILDPRAPSHHFLGTVLMPNRDEIYHIFERLD